MRKKILLLIVLLLLPINSLCLSYGGCEYSVISRLKSLVTNVNISYSYKINNNKPSFDVTLVNITPDMYFYDTITKKNYYYSDTNNGEITIYNYSGYSGSFKFYSAKSECHGISLGTKYYKFPIYNEYYNDPLCNGLTISVCKKWANVNYSRDEFENLINEYENPIIEKEEGIKYEKDIFDYIVDFYVNYYYYILISIIVICVVIIVYKSKKDKFKL